jgi:hypothetical protein
MRPNAAAAVVPERNIVGIVHRLAKTEFEKKLYSIYTQKIGMTVFHLRSPDLSELQELINRPAIPAAAGIMTSFATVAAGR